jgi:hypothetical protein
MTPRLGVVLGLLLAAAVGTWWLAATRSALGGAGDPAAIASQALFVSCLARAMLVSVVALRAAAAGGFGAGARTALPVVSAAWPVVALAWLASIDSLGRTFMIEAALVAFALAAALVGHGVAIMAARRAWTVPVATALGIALACGVWRVADAWRPALGG